MYEKWKESQYDSYNALNAKSSKTYKVPQDFTIRFSKSFSFAVGMDCRTGPRWPKAEDDELSRLVDRHGTESWKKVASLLQLKHPRSAQMCMNRWKQVIDMGLTKGPWTEEEDQVIRECVLQGITKWSDVAKRVPGHRVGKQCRERWSNHLDPQLKKSAWTSSEDDLLTHLQAKFGNCWTKIAHHIPGRRLFPSYILLVVATTCTLNFMTTTATTITTISENEVKNRWNSAGRKKNLLVVAGKKRRFALDESFVDTHGSLTAAGGFGEQGLYKHRNASRHGHAEETSSTDFTSTADSQLPSGHSSHSSHSSHQNLLETLSDDDFVSLQFADMYLSSLRLARQQILHMQLSESDGEILPESALAQQYMGRQRVVVSTGAYPHGFHEQKQQDQEQQQEEDVKDAASESSTDSIDACRRVCELLDSSLSGAESLSSFEQFNSRESFSFSPDRVRPSSSLSGGCTPLSFWALRFSMKDVDGNSICGGGNASNDHQNEHGRSSSGTTNVSCLTTPFSQASLSASTSPFWFPIDSPPTGEGMRTFLTIDSRTVAHDVTTEGGGAEGASGKSSCEIFQMEECGPFQALKRPVSRRAVGFSAAQNIHSSRISESAVRTSDDLIYDSRASKELDQRYFEISCDLSSSMRISDFSSPGGGGDGKRSF